MMGIRKLQRATIAVVVLVAVTVFGPHAMAQDTTPAAGPVGVTSTLFGSGQPSLVPGHELSLRRVMIEPGGGIPAHTHPGALVIYLESGSWGYIPLGGVAHLTRAAVNGTPSPIEDMVMGAEIVLSAGDWIYVEDPADDIRNAGDEPVVLWIAALTPVGEPFTTLMPEMDGMMTAGTPTP
jgi:quercetin dioxygenase-like cupin family protein